MSRPEPLALWLGEMSAEARWNGLTKRTCRQDGIDAIADAERRARAKALEEAAQVAHGRADAVSRVTGQRAAVVERECLLLAAAIRALAAQEPQP